jgi:hypothetical protein
MYRGYFPRGVKRLGCDLDRPIISLLTEVKSEWSYTSSPLYTTTLPLPLSSYEVIINFIINTCHFLRFRIANKHGFKWKFSALCC